ncbi:MAG TPA: DUF1501 domain-containing protein [Phycisphaerales bacterium]|nr:DUF1501 domain-containing protein [Phycisphaerales bacterium]
MTTNHAFTRRSLIKHGLLMASASVAIPAFLDRSALAMGAMLGDLSSVPGVPDERVLVVVQLSGGNDGLNTVVPIFSPEYYRMRQGIAVSEKDAISLDKKQGIGLHPGLAGVKDLYDQGLMALVQGVGYPNPNRSHFKSMDIWHTADTTATGNGWLGRYFDSECCGEGKGESGTAEVDTKAGPPGIAIGRTAPLAMEGGVIKPVAFEDPSLFRWSARDMDKGLASAYDELNRREEIINGAAPAAKKQTNAEFLVRTSLDAQVSSDLIRKAVANKPATNFPTTDLGRQLSMVASMIKAGLKTRVYYTSFGSFDTHAGQGGTNGRHAQLLRQFGDAMKAFYTELKAQGNDQRVMTMSFSEFGRRVGQNASQGTDHGTAAPMMLFGPMVRGGVLNEHPSMRDLDDGDLRFTTDFRGVYAGVLNQWLKADATKVLDGKFKALDVLKG